MTKKDQLIRLNIEDAPVFAGSQTAAWSATKGGREILLHSGRIP